MYRQTTNFWKLPELSSAQELVAHFLKIHEYWFTDPANGLHNKLAAANDYLVSEIIDNETGVLLTNKNTEALDEYLKAYLWGKFNNEFFKDFEYVSFNMLAVLRNAVQKLQAEGTFKKREAWESLYIDYEKPFVSRLWTNIEIAGQPYRVYLHRIHACTAKEALYHPHPWPSAMVICDGGYEMGLGYGPDNGKKPPVIGPVYLNAPTGYQMLSPLEWHYVAPKHDCMTIMITGTPFPKFDSEKPPRPKMRPLLPEEADCLYRFFGDEVYGTAEHIINTIDELIGD